MSPWPQSKGNNLFILWPVHKSLVLLLLLFLKHVQHPFAPPVHCNTEGGGVDGHSGVWGFLLAADHGQILVSRTFTL